MSFNTSAAKDRALATIQAGLTGGSIKLGGTLGGGGATAAGKADAEYLTQLFNGLVAAIQAEAAKE